MHYAMSKACGPCVRQAPRRHCSSDSASIRKYQPLLSNPVSWHLSSPSTALPVLDLLARAGASGRGDVERAASSSLLSMSPLMTTSERLRLKDRMTSLFSVPELPGARPPADAGGDVRNASAKVSSPYDLYSAFAGGRRVSAQEFSATCHTLELATVDMVSLLIVLELAGGVEGEDNVVEAHAVAAFDEILRRVRDGTLGYTGLHLLTVYLNSVDLHSSHLPNCVCFRRLWELCVQEIHRALPEFSAGQLLFLHFAVLECCTRQFRKPFVLISEMERALLAAAPSDFTSVPLISILRFLDLPFVKQKGNQYFTLAVLTACYTDGKVMDASVQEAGFCLKLLSELHSESRPRGGTSIHASVDDVDALHECLFALIYTEVHELSAEHCLAVLEYSEAINCSSWGIPVHLAFSKRVRDALMRKVAKAATRAASHAASLPSENIHRRVHAEADKAEKALHTALRLRNLLRRCALLPFRKKDEVALEETISILATPRG